MELKELSVAEWQLFSAKIDSDIFECITLAASVNARSATGGTAEERVRGEIERLKAGK
jgi:argininosuccinate lyase